MSADKKDSGKAPLDLIDLIPECALVEEGRVMQFGLQKYSLDNWRKGMEYRRLVAAARRHLAAWAQGISLDPESGISHLAHARCCLAFLMEYEATQTGTDDRFKRST